MEIKFELSQLTPIGGFYSMIFFCTMNHLSVEKFLQNTHGPALVEGDMVIMDGASVHKCDTTLDTLDEISNCQYSNILFVQYVSL